MKICVYGLGAVGGLIGGRLAGAGFPVSAIARGATLKAIQENGLTLQCGDQIDTVKIAASDKPSDLGPQDVVIVSVKNTSINSVASEIAPLLHKDTTIVSAMNGIPWWFYYGLKGVNANKPIESVDPNGSITEKIAHSRVVGCVSNLSSSMPAPGIVRHQANPKFNLGEPTGGANSERCLQILDAFKKAGLDTQPSESIQQTIWFKLWGNMTLNPISAMTGSTSDRIVSDPMITAFMINCMEEAQRIGSRLGINIDSTPEARIEVTRKLGAFKTSMLQDAEAGRPLELDALVGAVREVAADVGVQTPNIDALFGLSRLFARSHGLYPA